jgi:hypothetical protein
MTSLSIEAVRILRGVGWRPGRKVDVTSWEAAFANSECRMHQAAGAFLAEFGGLTIPYGGPGLTRAREKLEFDPLLALGEEDRFADWSGLIDRTLFPVGELDHGRYFLGIDEAGEIYLVADWLARFGSIPQGLDRLILGDQPDPIFDGYTRR